MEISAPRYTVRALPAYRFLPGRDPHPTADPRGHSVGASPLQDPLERWLYGCDLYNHGYWWEAHEAWEGLWLAAAESSRERRLLQGLIQVANCHLKRRMERPRAVIRLRCSYREHLMPLLAALGEGELMGLPLASWLRRVESYYDELPAGAHHDPQTFPFILLVGQPPQPWRSARSRV